MRYFASILSCYILTLSIFPILGELGSDLLFDHCTLKVEIAATEMTQMEGASCVNLEVSDIETTDVQDEKGCCDSDDCCGDVCFCSYHISIVVSSSLNYFPFETIPESDLWDFFDNDLIKGPNFSVWQPPRFIS